jgi:hypothetical protein
MAEEKDPLQGNEGATQARIDQLKMINREGAQAKAALEGLAGAFKNLGAADAVFAERAVKSSNEIAGQVKNFSKSYKDNIDLAKKLSGFTTNQLKDTKTRNAFEKQVLKAEAEQASVQAQKAELAERAEVLGRELYANEVSLLEQIKQVVLAEEQVIAAKQQQKDISKDAEAQRKTASDAAFESQKKSEDLSKQIALLSSKEGLKAFEQSKGAKATQGELVKIINQKKAQLAAEQDNIKAQSEQMEAAEKMKTDASNVVKSAEDKLKVEKAVAEALEEQQEDLSAQVITTDMMVENLSKAAQEIENGLNYAQGLSTEIEKVNNATPKFIEAFEKFGAAASGIPIIGSAISFLTGGISEASKKFKTLKAEGKGAGEAVRKAFGGFVFAGLTAALTAFISLAVDGAKKSSEAVVTLNKSVAGSMVNMQAQMSRVSAAAGKFSVPLNEAAATIAGINDSLGTSLDFTKETTEQAIKLANKYGVSVDAVAHIVKNSAANKKTMTETVDAVTAGVARFNEMNNVSISTKAIFEDIGKASATTLRGIGKQPGALAAAAAAARSLGMSMEDIRAASESTTDFQKSLTDEMTTEMMLGKQLNLNKLREAALTGNVTTQAEEMKRLVMENQGRIGNNVKLQEQFAATLGITRDQYNDIIKNGEALSTLTEKSGAAEEANGKARKMSQEDIAKSVEKTTGKLTSLGDKIAKFQENMALGANSFASDIIDGFDDGFMAGMSNIGSMMWDEISKAFEEGFDYFKSGSNVGRFLGVLAVGGGAAITFKAAKGVFSGIKSFLGLGSNKPTGSAMDPIHTVSGGMNAGDLTQSLGKAGFFKQVKTLFKKPQVFFRALKMKGGFLGKQIGRFGTMFSKMKLPNLTKIFSKIKLPNLGNIFSKLKFPSGAASGILKTVGGKILAPLELAMGAFKGVNQVKDLTAEQKKEQGIREDMGVVEAGVLGALTGGAEKGSMFSEKLGIEKGGAGDEALGIASAGARGAMTGAAIGSVIPVVGTAVGAAVGGAIGLISEGFKVFSDPNSTLRKGVSEFATATWDKAKEIGNKVKEGAIMVGAKIKDFAVGVKDKAVEVAGRMKDFAVGVKDKAFAFASSVGEGISNFATSAKDKAVELASAVGEGISNFATSAKEKIGAFASTVGAGVANFASTARDKIAGFASSIGEGASKVASKIGDFISESGGFANAVGAAARGLASKAKDMLGSAWKGVKNFVGMGDKTKSASPEIKQKEIKKVTAPLMQMSKDQAKTFTTAINTAIEKSTKGTVKAMDSLGDVLENPLGENAKAANNQLVELKKLKESSDKQHSKELLELRNQTLLLYQYIKSPQKNIIKMNTFKVGQSLTRV